MHQVLRSSTWTLISLFAWPLKAEDVGVFLPLVLPSADLSALLQDHIEDKNLGIKVFAKFEEFEQANKEQPFAAVIVPSTYTQHNNQCTPSLQFLAEGDASTFQYEIIAKDKEWDLAKIAEGSIGIVSEMDRKQTQDFVQTILSNPSIKRIKRVSKAEDLLPLLALGNVDYILIQPYNLAVFSKTFEFPVFKIGKSQPVRHPIVCVRHEKSNAILKSISLIKSEALNRLGYKKLAKY